MHFSGIEESGISGVNYNDYIVNLIGEKHINFDEIDCILDVYNDRIDSYLRMCYDCEDG